MKYIKRVADNVLQERLEAFGAVLVEGPKWCGKTTTSEQIAKSVIKLQDTEMREEYLAAAARKPSILLLCDMGCCSHHSGSAWHTWTVYLDWVKCC